MRYVFENANAALILNKAQFRIVDQARRGILTVQKVNFRKHGWHKIGSPLKCFTGWLYAKIRYRLH